MEVLDLSSKKLSHLSGVVMGALLKKNTTMKDLNLRSNSFGPRGGRAVTKALPASLRALNFGNNSDVWGADEVAAGGGTGSKPAELTPDSEVEMQQEVSCVQSPREHHNHLLAACLRIHLLTTHLLSHLLCCRQETCSHPLTGSLTHPPTHSSTHARTHPLTYPLTHSLTHSLTH